MVGRRAEHSTCSCRTQFKTRAKCDSPCFAAFRTSRSFLTSMFLAFIPPVTRPKCGPKNGRRTPGLPRLPIRAVRALAFHWRERDPAVGLMQPVATFRVGNEAEPMAFVSKNGLRVSRITYRLCRLAASGRSPSAKIQRPMRREIDSWRAFQRSDWLGKHRGTKWSFAADENRTF